MWLSLFKQFKLIFQLGGLVFNPHRFLWTHRNVNESPLFRSELKRSSFPHPVATCIYNTVCIQPRRKVCCSFRLECSHGWNKSQRVHTTRRGTNIFDIYLFKICCLGEQGSIVFWQDFFLKNKEQQIQLQENIYKYSFVFIVTNVKSINEQKR